MSDVPPDPATPAARYTMGAAEEPSSRTPIWRLLLGNPLTVASMVVLVAVVIVAIFGQWIAPYGVNDVDVPNALQGPTTAHWFGTDDLGRDIFSRVLVATRVSLEVAVISVTFAFVVGVTIGIVSGYSADGSTPS